MDLAAIAKRLVSAEQIATSSTPEWYSSGREFLDNPPPIDPGRTPAEDKAGVSLPGDTPEGVNQYVGTSPQKLLAKLRSENLTSEQRDEIQHALQIHAACTGDGIWGPAERRLGLKPPKPRGLKPPPFKLTI